MNGKRPPPSDLLLWLGEGIEAGYIKPEEAKALVGRLGYEFDAALATIAGK